MLPGRVCASAIEALFKTKHHQRSWVWLFGCCGWFGRAYMTCYDQNSFCDRGVIVLIIQKSSNSKTSHLVVNLVHALSSPIGHISRWHGFPQHNCFRTVRLDRSAFYRQRTPRAPSKRYSAVSTTEHLSILRQVLLTYGHPDLMMSFNHQAAKILFLRNSTLPYYNSPLSTTRHRMLTYLYITMPSPNYSHPGLLRVCSS